MENIKLIKKLEKISLNIPDKLLRLKGFFLNGNDKEYLEIIIYKGFSSSTTHPIEHDLEKNTINGKYILSKSELLKAPISENLNKVIKEVEQIELFLNIDFWY
mgnify:CR=1 FL=1